MAECNNSLYYRPVTILDLPTGGYHTFWYTQTSMTDDQEFDNILDAGPTNFSGCPLNCGFLIAYLNIGDVGYTPDDSIFSATLDLADTFGPNFAQCRAGWDMKSFTSTWPGGTIQYKILGPNSNTFTYEASVAAVLPTIKPPVYVPGWSQ